MNKSDLIFNCNIELPAKKGNFRELTDNLLPSELLTRGKIPLGWETVFEECREVILQEEQKLQRNTANDQIIPPLPLIFRMYQRMAPSSIRVMIFIDEPDHSKEGRGNMCGYGFSSSLSPTNYNSNMRIERKVGYMTNLIKNRLFTTVEGMTLSERGSFEQWFEQGIFLSSVMLTTGENQSHKPLWMEFTLHAIKYISKHYPQTIFLLWGEEASKMVKYLGKCIYFKTGSIYRSGGEDSFQEMNHFNIINTIYRAKGEKEIDWKL